MKQKFLSVCDFFEIEDIGYDFIITKDNSFVKILDVEPLNLSLKSVFEKELILKAYKTLLKNLDGDIQIIIQSKNIDLKDHLNNILNNQDPNLKLLISSYFSFIQNIKIQTLYSKRFFIVISQKQENKSIEQIKKDLNEKAQKIIDEIKKCGNTSKVIEGIELEDILYSFFNVRLSFQRDGGDF